VNIIVLSTEHWNAKRQARKELLYKSLLETRKIDSLLYVEPMRLWWRDRLESSQSTSQSGKVAVRRWACLIPGERLAFIQDMNRFWQAKRVERELETGASYVGIFYHPVNWLVAKRLKKQAKWYFDWTEDWGVYQNSSEVANMQIKAIKESDGVITVSESLYKRACTIRGSDDDVLLLPNATALDMTMDNPKLEPSYLSGISSPRLGLMGHIGPWMDAELIVQLAKAQEDWQWCILGDARGDVRRQLDLCANVHLLGIHPYQQLPDFMAYMDVLVAPYNNQAQGDSSKLYDYLVSGKPVVSSEIDTASRLSEVVATAHTLQQWLDEIQKAFDETDVGMLEKRRSMARLCTWQARAEELLEWFNLKRY